MKFSRIGTFTWNKQPVTNATKRRISMPRSKKAKEWQRKLRSHSELPAKLTKQDRSNIINIDKGKVEMLDVGFPVYAMRSQDGVWRQL
jgi:hypothetical protein